VHIYCICSQCNPSLKGKEGKDDIPVGLTYADRVALMHILEGMGAHQISISSGRHVLQCNSTLNAPSQHLAVVLWMTIYIGIMHVVQLGIIRVIPYRPGRQECQVVMHPLSPRLRLRISNGIDHI
jgi:hypothetical protein